MVDKGALLSSVDSAGRTARDLTEKEGFESTIKALDNEPSIGYIFEDRLIKTIVNKNFAQSNQLLLGFYPPVFIFILDKECIQISRKAYT